MSRCLPRLSYQQEAGVGQAEGARPADASAAVHHYGAVLWAERPRLADFEKEVQEGGWRFGDAKVRPRGVVEMQDLPGLLILKDKDTRR